MEVEKKKKKKFLLSLFFFRYSNPGAALPGSLLAARQVQMRQVPESDEVTPVRKKTVDLREEIVAAPPPAAPPSPPPPKIDDEEIENGGGDVESSIVRYIKNSGYFLRILLFEPIPMLQLQDDLRNLAGIKVSKQKLAAFLDGKGIDFLNPDSKWK